MAFKVVSRQINAARDDAQAQIEANAEQVRAQIDANAEQTTRQIEASAEHVRQQIEANQANVAAQIAADEKRQRRLERLDVLAAANEYIARLVGRAQAKRAVDADKDELESRSNTEDAAAALMVAKLEVLGLADVRQKVMELRERVQSIATGVPAMGLSNFHLLNHYKNAVEADQGGCGRLVGATRKGTSVGRLSTMVPWDVTSLLAAATAA